jgi:hypothetical protein
MNHIKDNGEAMSTKSTSLIQNFGSIQPELLPATLNKPKINKQINFKFYIKIFYLILMGRIYTKNLKYACFCQFLTKLPNWRPTVL